MKRLLAIFIISAVVAGCGGFDPATRVDTSIQSYRSANQQISLGDSKEKVIILLEKAQRGLALEERKHHESYMKGDVLVEIYYARSARIPDGLATDDEFTPYIFHGDKLVGIGWTMIGGAKSQGQVINDVYVAPARTGPIFLPRPAYVPSRLDFPKPIPSGGMFRY